MLRVGLVGLGTIATTHIEVLSSFPNAQILFGVDTGSPSATLPPHVPLHRSLREAFDLLPDLDLLVIATPTPTHVPIVAQALDQFDGLILVEKPLSHSMSELAALEVAVGHQELEERVCIAHHFAFSPEVLWAARLLASRPQWGVPTQILCSFNDAYSNRPVEQLEGYVSSWIDSGGNQLSLLSRFVSGFRLVDRSEHDRGYRSSSRLLYDGGQALLVSNWLAADTSKQTTLWFTGGIEVRMDHTSMTVLVIEGGSLIAHFGNDGLVGRKFAHYEGLYRELLGDERDEQLGYALARQLAVLLEAPVTGVSPDWV